MPKFFAGLYLKGSIISLLVSVCVFRIYRLVFSAYCMNNFASVI